MRVKIGIPAGRGSHYEISFPNETSIIDGITIWDRYRRSHFNEKDIIISCDTIVNNEHYIGLTDLLNRKEVPFLERKARKDNSVRLMINITKLTTDPKRLSDENGDFISSYPGGDGQISLGYLEELCEWLYYREDLEKEEKLTKILQMEQMMRERLGGNSFIKGGINFIPTWSTKLQ